MEKYKVAADFNGSGLMPIMSSVTTAIPQYWSYTLFVLWIALNAAAYFAILKLTGKKRFWHTFTSTSFVFFVVSLVVAFMNTATIRFLSGYWIGFYILMTVIGYVLLENYK